MRSGDIPTTRRILGADNVSGNLELGTWTRATNYLFFHKNYRSEVREIFPSEFKKEYII